MNGREVKCERCDKPEIVGMWSHDGLPGHEILVCNACWNELTADEKAATLRVLP